MPSEGRLGAGGPRAAALVVTLAVAVACACGGAPVAARPSIEPSAPPTDADPPTFTPTPGASATTGAPVGLLTRGRDDDARRVVQRFLEALRDRDVPTLEAVLADPLARASGVIARAALITNLQRAAEANGLVRGSEFGAFFDVPHALVEPLAARRDARRTSARYRDDDVLVTFPVRAAQTGRRLNDLAFVHMTVGELVVRLSPEPHIVGL